MDPQSGQDGEVIATSNATDGTLGTESDGSEGTLTDGSGINASNEGSGRLVGNDMLGIEGTPGIDGSEGTETLGSGIDASKAGSATLTGNEMLGIDGMPGSDGSPGVVNDGKLQLIR